MRRVNSLSTKYVSSCFRGLGHDDWHISSLCWKIRLFFSGRKKNPDSAEAMPGTTFPQTYTNYRI
jgi:hypothetical protein